MLSKTEREYVNDPNTFFELHGSKYTSVIRAKIKKKVKNTLTDLLSVLAADRHVMEEYELERKYHRSGEDLHYRYKKILDNITCEIGTPREISESEISFFVRDYIKLYKKQYDEYEHWYRDRERQFD